LKTLEKSKFKPTQNRSLKKSLKHLKETITELLPQVKHIGLGDPRRLLVVYYLKTDADKYLQEIYFFQNFFYGDEIPHRIELRLNSDFFKKHRKIFFTETIEEVTNLDNLIHLSVNLVRELLPQIIPYMEEKHPLFTEPHQYFINLLNPQTLAEGEKIVRKLSLQEEALRLLSQFLRIQEQWQATPKELIYTLKEMILDQHPKILKKAKEKKKEVSDLYALISNLCK